MSRNNVGQGKTNKHKSTQKAYARSQVASAAPTTRGKPPVTAAPKRRAG